MATPSSVKQQAPTEIIVNPLHQFVSYTYNWSLWRLAVDDANIILSQSDANTAATTPLSPNSYCIAEDSGLYSDRRPPAQFGLNYNIQTVEFDSIIGLNSTTKTSNMTNGRMTIIEPYGVTWLDTLVYTSAVETGSYTTNYLTQPYMLQLDFTGYDDSGNIVPVNKTFRKRFPIEFSGIKIKVGNKGTEYQVEYFPVTQKPWQSSMSTTPAEFNISAGTVKEFFDAFKAVINAYWRNQIIQGKISYADVIDFKIDPNIEQSTIVNSAQLSLLQANPNSGQILDVKKGYFTIPKGSQIIDVIDKVLVQSSYLLQQLGLDQQSAQTIKKLTDDQTAALNHFKTTCGIRYAGQDRSGTVVDKAYSAAGINRYCLAWTYNIHQYPVYDGTNPRAPQLTDTRAITVKDYNYIYTGKNIDILKLDINFDTTYYTTVAAYINDISGGDVSKSTQLDSTLSSTYMILPNLAFIAQAAVPALSRIPNPTPLRYKLVQNDLRDNTGMNISTNPDAQVGANVARSLYSRYPSGDMLKVEITIVGDPTLIKQDDVLYSPDPTAKNNYNSWDSISQAQYVRDTGSMRMDTGQLVARLTINTPLDIDTDWAGTGLVFPQANTYKSLFSGQYQIKVIKNKFEGGQFTQTLTMIRYPNTSIVEAATPAASTGATGNNVASTTVLDNSNNSRIPTESNQTGATNGNSTIQPVDNNTIIVYGDSQVDTSLLSPSLANNDNTRIAVTDATAAAYARYKAGTPSGTVFVDQNGNIVNN